MCSVQVLLFAEAMRRSTGVRSSPGPRPGAGVCRRLFANENGSDDPSRVLRRMEEQLRQKERERWNFDFAKEQPLPGRYQWVRVDAPDATHKTTSSENAPEVEVVAEVSARTAGSSPATQRRSCAGAASTQSKITDFLRRKKKRVLPEKDASVLKAKSRRRAALSGALSASRLR